MSLRQKTVSGIIWVGIQKFSSIGISFISNIVLARLLTPDDFGYIGMLMVFIALANTFVDGGFGSALIQKTNPTQVDYSTIFYWNLILSIILYVFLYFGAPFIASFYNMPLLCSILRLQGIIIIINACTIVQFNILRKQMLFKKISTINIASSVISVIVAIVYAYFGGGVWALVTQQIVQGLCNLFFIFIFISWKPLMIFSLKSFKSLFGFGSFMLLSNLINTAANNISALIIGKFFSAGMLGYLTQAQKIENLASTSIASTVEQVTYPLLVEVKEDYSQMRKVIRLLNVGLLAIVLPLMLGLIIGAEPILLFLFGEKWLPSVPILRILCIAGVFICLQGANYNVIAALGMSKVLFRWTVIKRLSGILVILFGFYFNGFTGVLYGMVLGSFLICLCNSWLVKKYINYGLLQQLKDLLPILLPTVFLFLLILEMSNFHILGENNIIYCIFFLLLYCLIFLFIPHPNIKEVRIILLNFISKNK